MWYAVSVKPLEMGGRGVRILEMIEVTSRKRWPVRISAEWDGGPEKPPGVKAGAEAPPVHSVWPVLAVRWHLIRPRSSPLPSRRCYHPVIRLRQWDAVINLIIFHARSGWSKTKLDEVVPTLPFSQHDKYLTHSASGIWGARGVTHRGTRSPISRFFSAPCPLASAKLVLPIHCAWGTFLLLNHPENSPDGWFQSDLQIMIEIKKRNFLLRKMIKCLAYTSFAVLSKLLTLM